ncbi:hypothetical protein [Nocardia brasiliensis]
MESFKRACIGILAGIVALYVAATLLQCIWPILLIVAGIVLVVWLTIVVIRTRRGRW